MPHTWRLELRNATDGECRAVHPVAVLADRGRVLRPGHFHLDFYDAAGSRWLPVRFERTEEAENVGVLGDGDAGSADDPEFPGFAVPAHGTVTVPLRLGFSGDAPEGPVTANVTAVQKRGADGAWVGESDDYTFAVGPRTGREPGTPPSPPAASVQPSPGLAGLADTGDARRLLAVAAAAGALLLAGTAFVFGGRRLGR